MGIIMYENNDIPAKTYIYSLIAIRSGDSNHAEIIEHKKTDSNKYDEKRYLMDIQLTRKVPRLNSVSLLTENYRHTYRHDNTKQIMRSQILLIYIICCTIHCKYISTSWRIGKRITASVILHSLPEIRKYKYCPRSKTYKLASS